MGCGSDYVALAGWSDNENGLQQEKDRRRGTEKVGCSELSYCPHEPLDPMFSKCEITFVPSFLGGVMKAL
jgi:hypothetical protein